jgi:hypothetical protein
MQWSSQSYQWWWRQTVLEIFKFWYSHHIDRLAVVPILEKVGELVLGFFSYTIKHVRRFANNLAQMCAKLAYTLESTSSLIDKSPVFLVSSLQADCTETTIFLGSLYHKAPKINRKYIYFIRIIVPSSSCGVWSLPHGSIHVIFSPFFNFPLLSLDLLRSYPLYFANITALGPNMYCVEISPKKKR